MVVYRRVYHEFHLKRRNKNIEVVFHSPFDTSIHFKPGFGSLYVHSIRFTYIILTVNNASFVHGYLYGPGGVS